MKRGYSLAYGAYLMLAVAAIPAKAEDLRAVCAADPRQFAEMFYTAKFKAKTIRELHELGNGLSYACPNSMRPGYDLARYIQDTLRDEVNDLGRQMYRFILDQTIQKNRFPTKELKICALADNRAMFQQMPLEDFLALQTFGTDVTRVTYKASWFSDTATVRIDRARTRETDVEEIQLKEGKHSNGTFYAKATNGDAETCLVATQVDYASGRKQELRFPQEGLSFVFMQTETFGLKNAARLAAWKQPIADYIPGWPKDGPWDAKFKELQTRGLLP